MTRPVYWLHTVAPTLWCGDGVYHDGEQYYEWPVEAHDLTPMASYAHVWVDGRRWNPPPPPADTFNPRHAH